MRQLDVGRSRCEVLLESTGIWSGPCAFNSIDLNHRTCGVELIRILLAVDVEIEAAGFDISNISSVQDFCSLKHLAATLTVCVVEPKVTEL